MSRRHTRRNLGWVVAAAAATALLSPLVASAAATDVHPTKSTYSPTERIDITWSDVPRGQTIQFWMEPAGTPLTGYPHGSYHSDYELSGHYALENPGPGKWEVHWSLLAQSGVVHQGGTFRVGAPKVSRVPSGHYGCYTTTTLGLTRSSIQSVQIRSRSSYRALGRTGRYSFSRKSLKLRMKSGRLRGRVAHLRLGDRPTIVFLRRENQRRGKPTIDVSDTYCYRGRQ